MENKTPTTEQLLSFLQVRTDSLIKYSQRIWTLFNWFLTLQVAIIGYYLGITQSDNYNYEIPIVGLTLSVLWLLLGINDFKSFKKHKEIKKKIEEKVSKDLGTCEDLGYNHSEKENNKKYEFRQSYMLMISPILFMLLWVYLIITVS